MKPIRHQIARLCLLLAFVSSGHAQTGVPQPVSLAPSQATVPLLRLHGPAGKLHLSLAELEGLGMKEVRTTTFWPDDDGRYAGPLLFDVLKRVGLENAEAIRIRARDGFSQTMPRQDWEKWPILLATRRDDKAISIRDKGPLRIIYPRGMAPELANSIYRLRWVWLVESIEAAEPK